MLPASRGGTGGFAKPLIMPPNGTEHTRVAGNPIFLGTAAQGTPPSQVLEPSVLYEDGKFKMWHVGQTFSGATLWYTECSGDPTVSANWSAPVKVLGGGASGYAGLVGSSFVTRIDGTLHVYFCDGTNLGHSTSATGSTDGSWATPTTVLLASSIGNGATQCTNSFVWKEGTNDWRMLHEVVGGTQAQWYDRIGYWTSTDGLVWTIGNGGLWYSSLLRHATFSASCAPFLIKEGATYHLWLHGNTDASGLPQDGLYATTTNLATDSWTTPVVVMTHAGSGTFEYDQFADLALIVVAGVSYMFYTGANNTVAESGPWFKIGIATATARRAV